MYNLYTYGTKYKRTALVPDTFPNDVRMNEHNIMYYIFVPS